MGFREDQQKKNQATQLDWSAYTTHRDRIDAQIRQVGPAASIALLGVGNGNDVRLDRLTEQFQEVHLIDCDEKSVLAGVARQTDVDRESLSVHTLDLTGAFERFEDEASSDAETLLQLLCSTPNCPRPEGFDCCVSLCLLSQLIEQLTRYIPPSHPRFADAVAAVRENHLRTLLAWTQRPGVALLITDFVSSSTAPQLQLLNDESLQLLLRSLLESGNFFHGLHPGVLYQLLTELVAEQPSADVAMLAPWMWDLGPRRYAVCGCRVTLP